MPHSSGGGSHGGGHHGGHHGGSGGGNSVRMSSRRYKGARHRYVYYHRGRPNYMYSDVDPSYFKGAGPRAIIQMVISLVFLVPFFVVGITMFGVFLPPKPIPLTYGQTEIVIEDTIGVINNDAELNATLKEFQNKTGITPAIVTVSDYVWKNKYPTLEDYAYRTYLDKFKDEKHWLFVYSVPDADESGFVDWKWEGMQGDDTDRILTVGKTNAFNSDTHEGLLMHNGDFGVALNDSMKTLNQTVMKNGLSANSVFGIFWMGVIILFAVSIISATVKTFRYKDAKEVDMDFETDKNSECYETSCSDCGGKFVVTHYERTCPYCGTIANVIPKVKVEEDDYADDYVSNLRNTRKSSDSDYDFGYNYESSLSKGSNYSSDYGSTGSDYSSNYGSSYNSGNGLDSSNSSFPNSNAGNYQTSNEPTVAPSNNSNASSDIVDEVDEFYYEDNGSDQIKWHK